MNTRSAPLLSLSLPRTRLQLLLTPGLWLLAVTSPVHAVVPDTAWGMDGYQHNTDIEVTAAFETGDHALMLVGGAPEGSPVGYCQGWSPSGRFDIDQYWSQSLHRFETGCAASGNDIYVVYEELIDQRYEDYAYVHVRRIGRPPDGMSWGHAFVITGDNDYSPLLFDAQAIAKTEFGVVVVGRHRQYSWEQDARPFYGYVTDSGAESDFGVIPWFGAAASCSDLAVTDDGDVIVVGTSRDPDTNAMRSRVCRMSPTGNVEWTSTIPDASFAQQVIVLDDGDLLVYAHPYVARLNANTGAVLWSVEDGDGPPLRDGLVQSTSGIVYTTGDYWQQVHLAAFDPETGELLGRRIFSMSGNPQVRDLAPLADGGLLLAGERQRNTQDVGWMLRLEGITPTIGTTVTVVPHEGGTVSGNITLVGGAIAPRDVLLRYGLRSPSSILPAITAGQWTVDAFQFSEPIPFSVTIPADGEPGLWWVQATVHDPATPDVVLNQIDWPVEKQRGVGVDDHPISTSPPSRFVLSPVQPNPFNAMTTVGVDLPAPSPLTVTVYDLLGRPVRVLHDGPATPGSHRFTFDGNGLASGTYLLSAEAGDQAQVRRITLVK